MPVQEAASSASRQETAAQGAMFDGMIRDEQHAEFLEAQMNAIQE